MALNDDFAQRIVIDTAAMDWQASPSPTVWSKRLELVGGQENGRVTSVVRYDPGSSFHGHDHPDGEEILVLEGEFCDEHGRYPAGTHLLNPEGFRHAPFSDTGCVLFVKLRQFGGDGRTHFAHETASMAWQDGPVPGVSLIPLYQNDHHGEQIGLIRFAPGASFPDHPHDGIEEIFVIDGMLADEHGRYPAGTWLRQPAGSRHAPHSDTGAVFYVKTVR